MMIPWYVILIPQFFIMQKLHLYDTHWSLILTGAFNVFSVFLLRQNMLSIPDSLAEAAKIDGCGPWGIYVKIILPLCKTSLATLVVLTFNSVWNDYMGPMIYLDTDSKKTIQLGLATFRRLFVRITAPSWQAPPYPCSGGHPVCGSTEIHCRRNRLCGCERISL